MTAWLDWVAAHWLTVLLIAGILIAAIFVYRKREQLFYKG